MHVHSLANKDDDDDDDEQMSVVKLSGYLDLLTFFCSFTYRYFVHFQFFLILGFYLSDSRLFLDFYV